MNLQWKLHVFNYVPDSYVTDEVVPIMGVKPGTLVAAVSARVGVLFNGTATISIGDAAGAATGFALTTDITLGTAALYDGYGSYFSGANGHLYTAVDTIDVTYNYTSENGDTTDQGSVIIYIIYAELE